MDVIQTTADTLTESSLAKASIENPEHWTEEAFRPTGAIAFFVFLVILSLITWFGIYLLMLSRV